MPTWIRNPKTKGVARETRVKVVNQLRLASDEPLPRIYGVGTHQKLPTPTPPTHIFVFEGLSDLKSAVVESCCVGKRRVFTNGRKAMAM